MFSARQQNTGEMTTGDKILPKRQISNTSQPPNLATFRQTGYGALLAQLLEVSAKKANHLKGWDAKLLAYVSLFSTNEREK